MLEGWRIGVVRSQEKQWEVGDCVEYFCNVIQYAVPRSLLYGPTAPPVPIEQEVGEEIEL